MVLLEPVEIINGRLVDHFGIATDCGNPIWRVVWSEDQFEKRLLSTTPEGLELLTPEVREVPKYRQWIHNKYILEQLVYIPEDSVKELTVNTYSYEPLYVFEDGAGNPLPPKWEAIKFIIDAVNAARGKGSLAKYSDPENTPEGASEEKQKRLADIEEALFGNETDVTDALTYKQGIVVPSTYGES